MICIWDSTLYILGITIIHEGGGKSAPGDFPALRLPSSTFASGWIRIPGEILFMSHLQVGPIACFFYTVSPHCFP